MGKKKTTTQALVPYTPIVTGEMAQERARAAADAAWTKAQEDASRAYDQACHFAWNKYVTALRAHHVTNKKLKSGGTDFDKQYDKERETALKVWKETSERADKKLATQR